MDARVITVSELCEVIADVCRLIPEAVTPESDLIADLSMDSVDVLDLTMVLEERLYISISNDAVSTFKTVGDIVTYLRDKGRIKE